ncbi:MAG: ribonuclease P protein component [Marmoricola sp.]
MLPAPHRLRESAAFGHAVRRGRRAGGRLLVLHLVVDDAAPEAPAQVGLVVSRAVGNAVHRNRVKRRVRHLLRERLDRLAAGSLLVVRALPAADGATWTDLGRELDRGLSRLHQETARNEPDAKVTM